MALHVPKAPGFAQMMKEGARHFSGLEEAVYRNINACKDFAKTLRTAYGPNGMNKMVVNHLEKLFVTSDAGTIIRELDIEHPAAKLMVLAAEMMEQEVGDGTNFVVILCGALLEESEGLLRMGLTPAEITDGFELALEKALEVLPTLVVDTIKDTRNKEHVAKALRTSIMSKQYGNEDFIAYDLIGKACISVVPEQGSFNVENVRVCKILGSGLERSSVLQGMVFKRHVEGDINKVDKAKIAVYTCAIDIMQTETKGTVLIKTAEELKNFSRGEESMLENQIKSIADTGVNVIVGGTKFGDMALHYLNKYNIMGVKLPSKWDVRRLCKTVGATPLPRLTAPTPEETGYADSVYVDEVGETGVVVFQLGGKESRISTIVIRGATNNFMDDVERAVDDGVNTFKGLTKDGRLVSGGGATEIALVKQLNAFGDTRPGLDQYAVKAFANALETFPKTLAENTGVSASEVIAKLNAAHEEGQKNTGFDIEAEGAGVKDCAAAGILDLYLTKMWGLKYATQTACTILKVDQIIMAKRAGGPKPRDAKNDDDDD